MIDRFTFNFSEKRTQHSHVQINKAIIENFHFIMKIRKRC